MNDLYNAFTICQSSAAALGHLLVYPAKLISQVKYAGEGSNRADKKTPGQHLLLMAQRTCATASHATYKTRMGFAIIGQHPGFSA
jgi:hypothetical protein